MYFIVRTFLCFIFFAFLGWCMEVINGVIRQKKIVNRGFLIGPLCPIYGVGCLLLITVLNRYHNDPVALFMVTLFMCAILEYSTSVIMEKIFDTRWWDYSDRKFNINGRICLENLIPFGLCGLIVIYGIYPVFLKFIDLCPRFVLYILAGIIFTIFLVDVCLSFNIIMKFKTTSIKIAKDSTEEITKFVKDTLSKHSIFTRRLVNSFPNFKLNIAMIKNKLKSFKKKKK